MAGAVAVRDFRAGRRQAHVARLALVQRIPQRHPGKRFLPLAVLHVQAHAGRAARPAAHPLVFSMTHARSPAITHNQNPSSTVTSMRPARTPRAGCLLWPLLFSAMNAKTCEIF